MDRFDNYTTLDVELVFTDGTILNGSKMRSEWTLNELLTSSTTLRFGACGANCFEVTLINDGTSYMGRTFNLMLILDGDTSAPYSLGDYTVRAEKLSGDKESRKITAYDALYDMLNANVAEWYESVAFPLMLHEFRDSFLAHFGLSADGTLANDFLVEKTVSVSELSGKMVLNAIYELQGRFPNIGRAGEFMEVKLHKGAGLFPSRTLYPSRTLLPKALDGQSIARYIDVIFEDYTTEKITKVQIRQTPNDVGVIYGYGDNCYIIEDNFLLYGKSSAELTTIAETFYNLVKDISYTPATVTTSGNPAILVGDAIKLSTKHGDFDTYVLSRVLKGKKAIRDIYTANGEQRQGEKVNTSNRSLAQLKGKTNELIRTVEMTQSRITDVEAGLESQITQTAESLRSEFSSQLQAVVTYDNMLEDTQFWGERMWGDKRGGTVDRDVFTTAQYNGGFATTKKIKVYPNQKIQVSVDRMRDTVRVPDAYPAFRIVFYKSDGSEIYDEAYGLQFYAGVWARDYSYNSDGTTVPAGVYDMAIELLCTDGCHYRQLYVVDVTDGKESPFVWKPHPSDSPAQIAEMYSKFEQTAEAISAEVKRASDAEGVLSTKILATADGLATEISRATSSEESLSAKLEATAEQVSAKVSQRGGNNSSFGWSLTASAFELYSNNNRVMQANKDGVDITGKITASSGKIGDWLIARGGLSNQNVQLTSAGDIGHTSGSWQLKADGSAFFSNVTITGYATSDELNAVSAKVSQLTANIIKANFVSANDLYVNGKIKASLIDVDTLTSNTVLGGKNSPYQGTMYMGNIYAGRYVFYDGRNYSYPTMIKNSAGIITGLDWTKLTTTPINTTTEG